MKKPIHYVETMHGFEYGSASVSRFFSDEAKGWVVIGLKTPKTERAMQVYVTKTGKVRVFGDDGREWLPKESDA